MESEFPVKEEDEEEREEEGMDEGKAELNETKPEGKKRQIDAWRQECIIFCKFCKTISAIPQEMKPTKERLMIHRIVNNNFKSYAGKQVLGPFHKVYYCVEPLARHSFYS